MSSIVNDYLWHGYLTPDDLPEWLGSSIPVNLNNRSYHNIGSGQKLDRLFDHLCSTYQGPHLVPLSGGWDSRLILAALRERLNSEEIITVSYGIPGQLDYEIGALVARHAGVAHHKIDLRKTELTWEKLVRSVRKSPWTYVPNGYYESLVQSIGEELGAKNVWIGFMGDPLTGGHLPSLSPDTPQALWKKEFAEKQRFAKSVRLSHPAYYPDYPSVPEQSEAPFVSTEWYDFGIRQVGCIAPLFLPNATWNGWNAYQGKNDQQLNVLTPFCDAEWAGYWLNTPRELHRNQQLYLSMAHYMFPDYFELPSKYSYGVDPRHRLQFLFRRYRHGLLSRVKNRFPRLNISSNLMHNYLDFDDAFRQRDDFRGVLGDAVRYLKANEVTPWLNLDEIVDDHISHRATHGPALCLLLGLAVNLDVENFA